MGAGFELGFQRRDIPALNQTSPKLLLQISVSGYRSACGALAAVCLSTLVRANNWAGMKCSILGRVS